MPESLSQEKETGHQKYQLLSSGAEFYDDFIDVVDQAEKYIIIKAFLWRNDEAGQLAANTLKEAADRGVKVLILKDRIGAFYEYMEGNGQSFFHDSPLADSQILTPHRLQTVYAQAKAMSYFYGNEARSIESNPMREEFVGHDNVEAVHRYKTYDHSKVIVVDGKIGYLGGVGFGNDFFKEDEKKYTDYMLRINDEEKIQELIQVLSHSSGGGAEQQPLSFLSDLNLTKNRSSMHQRGLDFIRNTRERITIAMPYLGNPDYINALSDTINEGAEAQILVPQKANNHGARNEHFIKRLRRQVHNPDDLRVLLTQQMFHGKIVLRDDEAAFFGSHNFMADEHAFDELNIETVEPEIVKALIEKINSNIQHAIPSNGSPPWKDIFPASRAEYLSVKLNGFMKHIREEEIGNVREYCKSRIQNVVGDSY